MHMMSTTFGSYVRLLLEPFFRWWWASITGVASILSFLATPSTGFSFSRLGMSLLALFVSVLLFLTLTVLCQGWELFQARSASLEIVSMQKCRDYGGEYLVLFKGNIPASKGTLIEIRRRIGDLEAPFALVEVLDRNAQGYYQANPIWIAPVHLRDFTADRFVVADLVATAFVNADRIRDNVDHFSPQERT
jgi:hypothetical protein